MTEEVWKDIAGYEGIYKVSNLGNIKSFRKNKETVLKPYTTSQGYKQARLFKDGKSKGFFVHRLVAQAFLPNPENLPCINHKNEVKDDNRLENLEWCSYKYNSNQQRQPQRESHDWLLRPLHAPDGTSIRASLRRFTVLLQERRNK